MSESETIDWNKRKEQTVDAFDFPREGDLFTEMFHFFVQVMAIADTGQICVKIWSANHESRLLLFENDIEFRKRYSYGVEGLGYYVTLVERGK